MKKTYQKPEVDSMKFDLLEEMLDQTGSASEVEGSWDQGEW